MTYEEYTNKYPNIASSKLKKFISENNLKEHKCEECLLIEWQGKLIPLELHHIDGNNKNNQFDNIQFICPNCHALTDNYRGRNKIQNKRAKQIPEEEFLALIPQCYSRREVLIKLKLAGYGGNYSRINRILEENPELKFKIPEKPIVLFKPKKVLKEPEEIKEKRPFPYYEGSLGTSPVRTAWPTNEELAELVWQKSLTKLSKEFGVTDNAIRHRCQCRNIIIPPIGYWRKLEVGKIEECKEIKNKLFKKEPDDRI